MRSRFFQFISILLLTAVFVSPSLSNALHSCDQGESPAIAALADGFEPKGATLSETNQSNSQETPPVSHDEDCNCPFHRSGCHHGTAYMKGELDFGLTIHLETSEFSEGRSLIKPSPFLDGPFQPPRA